MESSLEHDVQSAQGAEQGTTVSPSRVLSEPPENGSGKSFDHAGAPEGVSSGESKAESDSAAVEKKAGPSAEEAEILPREPVAITLRSLLEAGVHFGHQTSRWCPAMAPYIFSVRNGIHIIDLPRTMQCWRRARETIVETVGRGGKVLFVGTKSQAQDAMIEEARRCGAFFVAHRWLGGMLTNFSTIRRSIERLNKVEDILREEETALKDGGVVRYTKKERLMMSREVEKLKFSLGGIRNMYRPPDLLFVVDIKREDIAVKEASRLDIPVVALVDTNCDPEVVTHPIPCNDDGTRAIKLFAAGVCDAVLEGRKRAEEIEAVQGKNAAASPRGSRRFMAEKVGMSDSASSAGLSEEMDPTGRESTGAAEVLEEKSSVEGGPEAV